VRKTCVEFEPIQDFRGVRLAHYFCLDLRHFDPANAVMTLIFNGLCKFALGIFLDILKS
jgi:hypothetical protein